MARGWVGDQKVELLDKEELDEAAAQIRDGKLDLTGHDPGGMPPDVRKWAATTGPSSDESFLSRILVREGSVVGQEPPTQRPPLDAHVIRLMHSGEWLYKLKAVMTDLAGCRLDSMSPEIRAEYEERFRDFLVNAIGPELESYVQMGRHVAPGASDEIIGAMMVHLAHCAAFLRFFVGGEEE